jgi:hypothetical protein
MRERDSVCALSIALNRQLLMDEWHLPAHLPRANANQSMPNVETVRPSLRTEQPGLL